MNLENQAEEIKSREDLAEFIRSLNRAMLQKPEEWENVTLERFLMALAAWAEDMDGYYENQGNALPKDVEWAMFGQMLLAASMYE